MKYLVQGNVKAEWDEWDEAGNTVLKRHHARGIVSTYVITINTDLAADVALSIWAIENDWPLDCIEWTYGPQVIPAPEDQQMRLINAPTLPGFEL
jgi:hypothetical protein